MDLTIKHLKSSYKITVPPGSTFDNLRDQIERTIAVPKSDQRLLAGGKYIKDFTQPVDSSIRSVTVIAAANTNADAVNKALENVANNEQRYENQRKAARSAYRTVPTRGHMSEYTFGKIEVLNLPHKEDAYALLDKLRNDRGVLAVMERYKWFVPVLAEMDPASNTTHESRTLGLNQNKGQKILLRIRTDWYEGFCNYKEIRKVLCHELAHNVHSEHDSAFWSLTHTLEKLVVDLDPYGGSGRMLSGEAVTRNATPEQLVSSPSSASPHVGHVLGSKNSVKVSDTARDRARKAAESRKRS
ncbi:hypothetical protein CANCADRAFT_1832 [Tortispora caseinolytica NRRL Y-17796]|uniref:WLM domain-containing protein n=1 Tax=Tortispora caseinolytica NRRL Y-17796 TaxID=767744 RepID=A0A1E4TEA5_9ASCO|nr:hypothetical protein CANCADRAFT_1832 [Tortispora caseinolytica NRRL Y-17796]